MGTVVQILKTIPQTFSFVANRSLSVDVMWAVTANLLIDNNDKLMNTSVSYEDRTFKLASVVDSNALVYIRTSNETQISYQMAKLCAQYITYIAWAYVMDSANPQPYIAYLKGIDDFLISVSAPNIARSPTAFPAQSTQSWVQTPELRPAVDIFPDHTDRGEAALKLLNHSRLEVIRWWYLLYTWKRLKAENITLTANDNRTIINTTKTELNGLFEHVKDIKKLVGMIDQYYKESNKTTREETTRLLLSIWRIFHKPRVENIMNALSSPTNEGILLSNKTDAPFLDIRVKLRLDRYPIQTGQRRIKTFDVVNTNNHHQHILMGYKDDPGYYLFGPFNEVYAKHSGDTNNVAADLAKYVTETLQPNRVFVLMGYGASGAGKTSYLVGRRSGDSTFPGVLVHLCKLLKVGREDIEFRHWYRSDQGQQTVTGKEVEIDKNGEADFAFFEKYMTDPLYRTTRPTLNNPGSSRGHMIAHINVNKLTDGKPRYIIFGDLAGFENAFTAGTIGAPGDDALDTRIQNSDKDRVNAEIQEKFNGIYYDFAPPYELNTQPKMPAGYDGDIPTDMDALQKCVDAYRDKLAGLKAACDSDSKNIKLKEEVKALLSQPIMTEEKLDENIQVLGKNALGDNANNFLVKMNRAFSNIITKLGPPHNQRIIDKYKYKEAKIQNYMRYQESGLLYREDVTKDYYNLGKTVEEKDEKNVYVILRGFIRLVNDILQTLVSSNCSDPFFDSMSGGRTPSDPEAVKHVVNKYRDTAVECAVLTLVRKFLVQECQVRNFEGNYIRESLFGLRRYISSITNDTPPLIPVACMESSMESLSKTSTPAGEKVEFPFPFSRRVGQTAHMDDNIDRICLFGVLDVNNVNKWKTAYYPTTAVISELRVANHKYAISCIEKDKTRNYRRNTGHPQATNETGEPQATNETGEIVPGNCRDEHRTSVQAIIEKFMESFKDELDLTSRGRTLLDKIKGHTQPDNVSHEANQLVSIIANHNEGTPIGVLEFLDRMAKFGRVNMACKVDVDDQDESFINEYNINALVLDSKLRD